MWFVAPILKSFRSLLMSSTVLLLLNACNGSVQNIDQSISANNSSLQKFAGGTRGVKILLNTNTTTGSFNAPTSLPSYTPIPVTYPGGDGVTPYNPGISATQYFALDGVTVTSKPSWLTDFQLGITSTSPSSSCASFGGGSTLDVSNTFRVSEADCGSVTNGTGGSVDPVFIRALLNRDPAQIGVAENLMVQIEYQASAIHLNSDGASSNVEDNLDQLWKIFWSSTLNPVATANPFAVFVPPNYSACLNSGTYSTGAPGSCDPTTSYRGAPIKVKQFIIPLSAYPSMNVVQISRVKGRINNLDYLDPPANSQAANYVSSFCATNTPLCLGVVIYSITLTRM